MGFRITFYSLGSENRNVIVDFVFDASERYVYRHSFTILEMPEEIVYKGSNQKIAYRSTELCTPMNGNKLRTVGMGNIDS